MVIIFSFTALLTGCSAGEGNDSPAPLVRLSQAKFEIDREQKIILTHDANFVDHDNPSFKVCVTDLPILHIATAGNEIADDPKVGARLKILQSDCEADILPIAIEWRGRTSQTFPKKSYGFEIRESVDSQSDVKRSLLGMRSDDDWILDSLWNEPVNIRDFTAHQIWRE
ncbi:CotH kinase family protein, partial [bacterium]|nr:CotH kinase family protein [bacterium]